MTRRDALRGLLALGLVAPSSALFAPAQRAAAQLWPPVWFWDSFNPSKLPGLVGWWRSDVPSSLYQDSALTTLAVADGDPVGGWLDQSGAGHHLLQATAGKRPTLKLAIQNGQNVLRLDGVDDFWSAIFTLAQPLTAFFVGRITNYTGHVCLLEAQAANTWFMRSPVTTGPLFIQANNGQGTITTPTAPAANTWQSYMGIFNGAASAASWGSNVPTTGALGANGFTTLNVGIRADASFPYLGDIAEILLWNRALAGTDPMRVQRYLQRHWQLAS